MTTVRRAAVILTAALVAAGFLTAVPMSSSAQPTGLTATSPPTARVVGEKVLTARLRELTIASPAMGRRAHARVLLPSRFAREPHRTWPVLYLLHGCCDVNPIGYRGWTTMTDLAAVTARSNMIVVMPEGGFSGFYSDWDNHGAGGAPGYETFHLTELRTIVESRYRASKVRAIAGLSMGGFGALSYAARHPGMFRFAASYSGLLDTQYRDVVGPALVSGIVTAGGDGEPTALWGDPVTNKATWSAHNPAALIPRLLRIPMFISCGNGFAGPLDPGPGFDPLERLLWETNVSFVRGLKAAGASVKVDFYGSGTHTWPYWQRAFHRSFPLIEAALAAR